MASSTSSSIFSQKNPSENWPKNRVAAKIGNESPEMTDLTGDGKMELVAMQGGRFGFFTPDSKDPTKPWTFHPISPERTKSPYYHGLGFGDLNGDGKTDILEKEGWYESPRRPAQTGQLEFPSLSILEKRRSSNARL